MNLQEVLALYDREQRREIEYPGMSRQVLPRLVRYVRPAPGMSFVLHSDLDEGSADAAINEQLAYFAALQQPFEWKVYAHDRPADLAQRLAARGFVLEEPDAIMAVSYTHLDVYKRQGPFGRHGPGRGGGSAGRLGDRTQPTGIRTE